MKIGDKVRVIATPAGVKDGELKTRMVFRRCLGHTFPIVGFQHELLELEVGEIFGRPAPCETIWIEPEFVEPIGNPRKRTPSKGHRSSKREKRQPRSGDR